MYLLGPAGDVKATGEFVPLLNIAYNQWKAVPKTPTTLNASAPATAKVTQNFTVKGRLTAGGTNLTGQNVTLQRSTNNATWTTITTKKTNDTGWYALSKNERAAGTFSYKATYAGNTTYTNATSNVVNVTVTKIPTTLNATAPATATINKNVTVKGRLTASSAGVSWKTITSSVQPTRRRGARSRARAPTVPAGTRLAGPNGSKGRT